jgi:hypothetical protein
MQGHYRMIKRFSSCRRYRRPAALPVLEVATSFAADAIEIVTTRLDTQPETVRALAELLSAEERCRADRYDFDRHRRRFIVARARLRQLLAMRLMTRPEAVELVYGAHGKPALARKAGRPPRFPGGRTGVARNRLCGPATQLWFAGIRGRDRLPRSGRKGRSPAGVSSQF